MMTKPPRNRGIRSRIKGAPAPRHASSRKERVVEPTAYLNFPSTDRCIVQELIAGLPTADNTPASLDALLKANQRLRNLEWPSPFGATGHDVHLGDARNLEWIPDESVHLVVTSPPYWTLKDYNQHSNQ